MGSTDITLATNTYYKGNYSCCREFTILQGSNSLLTVLVSILAVVFYFFFFNLGNGKWMSSIFLMLASIFSALTIFNILFLVKKESVLLVVPVAMQLTTTYLFGRQTISSIPWYKLGNLMILDVIVGQQVIFFLAVEVKNNDSDCSHIILFRHSKPRLKYLERIYRDFQEILDFSR